MTDKEHQEFDRQLGHPSQERLDEIKADNARREAAMGAQGAEVPGMAILALKVDALFDLLIEEDPERRVTLELAYQERLAKAFDQIEPRLAEAKLMQGVHNNGGIIQP